MPTKNHRNFDSPWGSILFILFLFHFPHSLPAQSTSSGKENPVVNWQLDATVKGVKFYHSLVDCNGKKTVFLKFDNENSYKVEVSWKEVFHTQIDAQTEGYSGQKKLLIGLGETKETDCNNPSRKELVILPAQVNPSYVADVSVFDYKAINVTKAK